jgi:TRAP-type C4-dicarboxylate transport system permease small subunit
MTSNMLISRIRDRSENYIRKAAKLFEYLSGSIVIFVTILLLFSILNRNLGWGVTGIQGTAQILGVWLTFLVIAPLEINRRHIRVRYFYNRFPSTIQTAVDKGIWVLSTVILGVLVISSITAVYEYRNVTPSALDISSSYFYGAAMFGLTLLFLVYVFKAKADSQGENA